MSPLDNVTVVPPIANTLALKPLDSETTSESHEPPAEKDSGFSLDKRTAQRVVYGANLKWQGIFPTEGNHNYPHLGIGGGLKAGYRLAPNSLWHFGGAIDVQALQAPVTAKSVDRDAHKSEHKEKEGIYAAARPLFGISSSVGDYYIKAGPSMIYDKASGRADFGLGGDLVIGSGLFLSAGGDYFLGNNEGVVRLAVGIGN